jgi:FkbM family methyltransferase
MSDNLIYQAPNLRLKACRYGVMMYLPNDQYIGKSLDLYGEFSEDEMALFRQIVHHGATVVDVGANIGCHTVFFSRCVGADGCVLAFEPQRPLFHILCGNIALNGQLNVVSHQAALGRQSGFLAVPPVDYAEEGNFGGMSLEAPQLGEHVPVLMLDSLNLTRCDFIKIDVEGMEEEVLRGAAATLATHRPILYVENDRREKSAPLITWLMEHDYRLYWHLPPLFNATNYFEESENVFEGIVSMNMLCIPASSDLVAKDFQAITSPFDTPDGVRW